jgi:CubicO group peptidase (beta-lactamase class C family)
LITQLARLEAHGLEGATGVSLAGASETFAGFGFADRDAGTPNAPDTVFDIGSISKQFTSTMALVLEQQGLLNSSDRISRFLPDVPTDKHGITLHHLMTHSAGFPANFIKTDFDEVSSQEAIVRILALPMESKIGASFRYTNVGYSLLGLILERVTTTDYQSLIMDNLFAPAMMAASGWYGDSHLRASTVAYGYNGTQTFGCPMQWPRPTWALLAAGGVLSTVGDLLRWTRALEEGKILDKASLQRLHQPFLEEYAYGWHVRNGQNSRRLISHGGANVLGFSALLLRFVDDGAVVAFTANTTYQGHFMNGLVEDVIEASLFNGQDEPQEHTVQAVLGASIETGIYESARGERIEVWSEGPWTVIGCVNQTAIDYIHGGKAYDRDGKRAEAARAIAELLAAGDLAGAAQEAGSPTDSAQRILGDAWSGAMYGADKAKKIEILGTEPATSPERVQRFDTGGPAGDRTTLVRVVSDRGRGCMRLAWSGDVLIGTELACNDVDRASAMRVSVCDGEFGALNLLTGAHLRLGNPTSEDTVVVDVAGRKVLFTREESG